MKKAIVLHGYHFSYLNNGLGPHNLALIQATINIVSKNSWMPVIALGGIDPDHTECGYISEAMKKALFDVNSKLTVETVQWAGLVTTVTEVVSALNLAKKDCIDCLILPLLWSHLPRTLWHYWWLSRKMRIKIMIKPVPIFVYGGWWARLLWDILATPRSLLDPLGKKSRASAEKMSRLIRLFFSGT